MIIWSLYSLCFSRAFESRSLAEMRSKELWNSGIWHCWFKISTRCRVKQLKRMSRYMQHDFGMCLFFLAPTWRREHTKMFNKISWRYGILEVGIYNSPYKYLFGTCQVWYVGCAHHTYECVQISLTIYNM